MCDCTLSASFFFVIRDVFVFLFSSSPEPKKLKTKHKTDLPQVHHTPQLIIHDSGGYSKDHPLYLLFHPDKVDDRYVETSNLTRVSSKWSLFLNPEEDDEVMMPDALDSNKNIVKTLQKTSSREVTSALGSGEKKTSIKAFEREQNSPVHVIPKPETNRIEQNVILKGSEKENRELEIDSSSSVVSKSIAVGQLADDMKQEVSNSPKPESTMKTNQEILGGCTESSNSQLQNVPNPSIPDSENEKFPDNSKQLLSVGPNPQVANSVQLLPDKQQLPSSPEVQLSKDTDEQTANNANSQIPVRCVEEFRKDSEEQLAERSNSEKEKTDNSKLPVDNPNQELSDTPRPPQVDVSPQQRTERKETTANQQDLDSSFGSLQDDERDYIIISSDSSEEPGASNINESLTRDEKLKVLPSALKSSSVEPTVICVDSSDESPVKVISIDLDTEKEIVMEEDVNIERKHFKKQLLDKTREQNSKPVSSEPGCSKEIHDSNDHNPAGPASNVKASWFYQNQKFGDLKQNAYDEILDDILEV